MFFYVEKTGETDFVEKPKSKYAGTPLGKWLYPKGEPVAMGLISGGRLTYTRTEIRTNQTWF